MISDSYDNDHDNSVSHDDNDHDNSDSYDDNDHNSDSYDDNDHDNSDSYVSIIIHKSWKGKKTHNKLIFLSQKLIIN